MLYPIARVRVGEFKEPSKYVMYNSKNGKAKVMDLNDLRDTKEEIVGITIQESKAKLKGYYNNLGYIGEETYDEETNKEIKCYTVVRKIYLKDEIEYILIGKNGKQYEIDEKPCRLNKEQLIDLIKQGNRIAGAKIVNSILRVATDIEETVESK